MGSILNPVIDKTVNGKPITVRELRAVDGLQFIKKLSTYFGSFQGTTSDVVQVKIAEVVTGAADVSEFLVLKSTGQPSSWLNEISTEEFLDVLESAIELNISEGLIKKGRGVVATVRGRMNPTTP